MSKYLSIFYIGTHSDLIEFLKSKDLLFEIKRIGDQKVFTKVPPGDYSEEIKFLKSDEPLDDTKDFRIFMVKDISETEYETTVENGFELIQGENKLTGERIQPMISHVEPIETNVNQNVRQSLIQTNVDPIVQPNLTRFSENSNVQQPTKTQNLIQDYTEPVNIGMALTNTNLPSKSPLQPDDPFVFLTSSNFLKNFVVASSLLLFVLTLFE